MIIFFGDQNGLKYEVNLILLRMQRFRLDVRGTQIQENKE